MSFEADIERAYQKKVVGAATELVKTIAQTAHRDLMTDSRTVGMQYGSPVWTGRFSASWIVSLGQPSSKVAPPHPDQGDLTWPDEPASRVRAEQNASEVRRVLEGYKLGGQVYISNALPYARRIEFGHSRLKAPAGVAEVTAEHVAAKFKNVSVRSLGVQQ